MKNRLDKTIAGLFHGKGTQTNSGAWHRAGWNKHPYMKAAFWQNSNNHFWNSGLYSDETKEYYNNWVTTL